MENRLRVFDSNDINDAESARQNGDIEIAFEISKENLYPRGRILTSQEIDLIIPDSNQRLMLACLARLHVDSAKTLANRSISPQSIIGYLEIAAQMISRVYLSRELSLRLMNVRQDHEGRPHFFLPEMERDRAKVLEAATVLYNLERTKMLADKADNILEKAEKIADGDPISLLISIERQILKAHMGGDVDAGELQEVFSLFVKTTNNKHRVATIASQIAALKLDSLFINEAEVVCRKFSEGQKWPDLISLERVKTEKSKIRKRVVQILTPATTSPTRREALFQSLIN